MLSLLTKFILVICFSVFSRLETPKKTFGLSVFSLLDASFKVLPVSAMPLLSTLKTLPKLFRLSNFSFFKDLAVLVFTPLRQLFKVSEVSNLSPSHNPSSLSYLEASFKILTASVLPLLLTPETLPKLFRFSIFSLFTALAVLVFTPLRQLFKVS
ncbi:hypothetical protein ACB098_12G115200 [Castanea mollissima]